MRAKETKRKTVVLILVGILLFAGLCGCIYTVIRMYISLSRENDELTELLNRNAMELSIRVTAEKQRNQLTADAEQKAAAENSMRLQLKDRFLARNREELLALVNPWNPIREDCTPHLTELGDKMQLDERAAAALEQMLRDCKKAGGFPVPISAYRTQEYQKELFENKLERVIASGVDPEYAPAKAAESVAVPGTSEHQLGLAIDIVDEYYPELDYQQEWTGTQQWLMKHCAEYGFILRYPTESSAITGTIHEPWHYRFVGRTFAAEITAENVTLEEYLGERNAE